METDCKLHKQMLLFQCSSCHKFLCSECVSYHLSLGHVKLAHIKDVAEKIIIPSYNSSLAAAREFNHKTFLQHMVVTEKIKALIPYLQKLREVAVSFENLMVSYIKKLENAQIIEGSALQSEIICSIEDHKEKLLFALRNNDYKEMLKHCRQENGVFSSFGDTETSLIESIKKLGAMVLDPKVVANIAASLDELQNKITSRSSKLHFDEVKTHADIAVSEFGKTARRVKDTTPEASCYSKQTYRNGKFAWKVRVIKVKHDIGMGIMCKRYHNMQECFFLNNLDAKGNISGAFQEGDVVSLVLDLHAMKFYIKGPHCDSAFSIKAGDYYCYFELPSVGDQISILD